MQHATYPPLEAALPSAFDLEDFQDYLVHTQELKPQNVKSVLSVARRLVSGKGVAHSRKPGETFRAEAPVTPRDDVEGIRKEAAAWLPYGKSHPNCLDRGHGWALNHPLQKLLDYKKERLLGLPAKRKSRGDEAPKKKKLRTVECDQSTQCSHAAP